MMLAMITGAMIDHLRVSLSGVESAGLLKRERLIDSPQGATVRLHDGRTVVNLCANNYLGLANHPRVVAAAHAALDRWGFGMASVRFICGTQTVHRQLEERLSAFLGTEETLLHPSCFDANAGLFEALLGDQDAVISDALNHASIIDGVRLCKAKRHRYANDDMADLERQLQQADANGARFKLITTDGVFSMDGIIARLDEIHALAEKHGALVHFDDCHATGFLGPRGRGTHEHRGLFGKIDLTTGTLGKALGGASGGYVSGRKELIDWLRQWSRPCLFSNSVAPPIVAASLAVLDLIEETPELVARLTDNMRYFRTAMAAAGFVLGGRDHPIIPVMLGDAVLAQRFAGRLLDHGVFAVGFCHPVVPCDKARIRTQVSAAHTRDHLDQAVEAFTKTGRELGVIH